MCTASVADEPRFHGWKVCGKLGTVQVLQEIKAMAQGMDERITAKLAAAKNNARYSAGARLEELEIEGLTLERALVFPSGLAGSDAIFLPS